MFVGERGERGGVKQSGKLAIQRGSASKQLGERLSKLTAKIPSTVQSMCTRPPLSGGESKKRTGY